MKTKVLVTGGTGYVASWIIKKLLDEGHVVHTTVRNKSKTDKYQHLLDIEKASNGSLQIFEADLLNEGDFKDAMKGCEFVFHTASPFFISGIEDSHSQLIEPALKGTQNVLETANEIETVKRIVLTSSIVAVVGDHIDIKKTKDNILTEEYWNFSSTEKHQPYAYSKTLAEKEAWRISEEQERWKLVVINPGFVLGPSLTKRTDSTSIDFMKNLLSGKFKSGVPNLYFGVVDVRDVAQAHINAAFRPEAEGRHITVSADLKAIDMANILRKNFGGKYKLPKGQVPKFMMYLLGPALGFTWKYVKRNIGIPIRFDNSYTKKNLGIEFIPIEQTLNDHAEQLIRDGLV